MAESAKNQAKSKDSAGAKGERASRGNAAANPGENPSQRDLARQMAALTASTEEQVDALRVDLVQDPRGRDTRDATGKIVDELARERMAGMTEVGPELEDKGVVSAVPGRDNPSGILRRHHPNTEIARAQNVVEGNQDEPRDEALMERRADEGTAA